MWKCWDYGFSAIQVVGFHFTLQAYQRASTRPPCTLLALLEQRRSWRSSLRDLSGEH